MAQSTSPLLNLPQEVYDNVCHLVPSTRDLKNLRLTCRDGRQMTEPVFVERQFREIETNLSPQALDYLLRVSKSWKYSDEVQAIVIQPTAVIGNVHLLIQALQKFKKLTRIDIARYNDPIHFNAGRVLRQDHYPPNQIPFEQNAYRNTTLLTNAFHMVVYAINESNTSHISTFSAGSLPLVPGQRNSIDHFALAVPVPINISRRNRKGIAGIEHLHLVLEVASDSTGLDCEQNLFRFLLQTPHLRSLRLEFWEYRTDWLSAALISCELRHLESLHIEAARNVQAAHLESFIHRHAKTLKHVTLSNIMFLDGDLSEVFPPIFQDAPLQLHSVRLQQICSEKHGLHLFDKTGVVQICEPCKEDLYAVWGFHQGPKCVHGGIVASGEQEVREALQVGLNEENMGVLPWNTMPIFGYF